jgi:hypothetical protein
VSRKRPRSHRCADNLVLRLALFATALNAASGQYCPVGTVSVCDSVLVVHTNAGDIQSTLASAGFSNVELFNAASDTPSSARLAMFHAVLVYTGNAVPFINPALLGDRLAAYHNQGGGVVIAASANMASNGGASMPQYATDLRGAYGTPSNGYALLNYASGDRFGLLASQLGTVYEAQSPLMTGVSSFASQGYCSTAPIISGRAVVVATWSGGQPLVLRGQRGNRTLVELNFYPASKASDYLGWTGDGAALLRNALKYSRCMPVQCKPGEFMGAGKEQKQPPGACGGMQGSRLGAREAG